MSQYIVLSKIKVQNANSIAGLTWGFPAITSLLGFTHSLSRKLQNQLDIELIGCAVISNYYQQHVYHDKSGIRFTQRKFGYTFKPEKNQSGELKNPSTIEEGKMNLALSLIIEIKKPISLTIEQRKQFETNVYDICCQMRLSGGTILDIGKTKLLSGRSEDEQQNLLKNVKRLVMPGFVLLDRSNYLEKHYKELKQKKPLAQLFDAWLDFSALRYKAIPKAGDKKIQTEKEELGQLELSFEHSDNQTKADEKTLAEWQYQPKPNSGYLVPLITGYKAISELYQPDEVSNTRLNPNDNSTQSVRFVEAIHSIGEWKGAHSIKSIDEIIWHYHYDDPWYLCFQRSNQLRSNEQSITDFTSLSETDALDFL